MQFERLAQGNLWRVNYVRKTKIGDVTACSTGLLRWNPAINKVAWVIPGISRSVIVGDF